MGAAYLLVGPAQSWLSEDGLLNVIANTFLIAVLLISPFLGFTAYFGRSAAAVILGVLAALYMLLSGW